MPYGDRTGPTGMGPMTGRAAGFCAGYSVPGHMNQARGQGFFGRGGGRGGGFGRGGGRGWRNQFYATGLSGWQRLAMGTSAGMAPMPGAVAGAETQLDALKRQADAFQSALADIQRRIEELQNDAEK